MRLQEAARVIGEGPVHMNPPQRSLSVAYSLGCNFDLGLIDGVARLNDSYGGQALIEEVFGAIRDAPVSSARPSARLPEISWNGLVEYVARLRRIGTAFNFLLNTRTQLSISVEKLVTAYIHRLWDNGVSRITVGTVALSELAKTAVPEMHVTMSITFGARSLHDVETAAAARVNAIYLDGVRVNRDFDLLRSIVQYSPVECRLYANVSCISRCPVVNAHYRLFANQDATTAARNDGFFKGCTLVKLNPVEWIQMPWIRPEDVMTYAREGITQFKLADRLSRTETLITIAESYLRLASPEDMFILLERDADKWRRLLPNMQWSDPPIRIYSGQVPENFIEHFRTGQCRSRNLSCPVCSMVAAKAVKINSSAIQSASRTVVEDLIPAKLLARARSNGIPTHNV
jgi:hypothetical protein